MAIFRAESLQRCVAFGRERVGLRLMKERVGLQNLQASFVRIKCEGAFTTLEVRGRLTLRLHVGRASPELLEQHRPCRSHDCHNVSLCFLHLHQYLHRCLHLHALLWKWSSVGRSADVCARANRALLIVKISYNAKGSIIQTCDSVVL